MAGLVDQYPRLSGFADAARNAGYSDDEIDGQVRTKLNESIQAGYSAEDVNKHLGVSPDSKPGNLATGPLGDFAMKTLEALAAPVETAAGVVGGTLTTAAKPLAAGAANIYSMITGAEPRAAERTALGLVEKAAPYVNYQPQSPLARTALEVASAPFTGAQAGLEKIGVPPEVAGPAIEAGALALPLVKNIKGFLKDRLPKAQQVRTGEPAFLQPPEPRPPSPEDLANTDRLAAQSAEALTPSGTTGIEAQRGAIADAFEQGFRSAERMRQSPQGGNLLKRQLGEQEAAGATGSVRDRLFPEGGPVRETPAPETMPPPQPKSFEINQTVESRIAQLEKDNAELKARIAPAADKTPLQDAPQSTISERPVSEGQPVSEVQPGVNGKQASPVFTSPKESPEVSAEQVKRGQEFAATQEQKPPVVMKTARDLVQGKTKEPWEMTQAEFIQAVREGRDFPQIGVKPTPLSTLRGAKDFTNLEQQARSHHQAQVTTSFVKGESIPPEVLKDYPELQQLLQKRLPQGQPASVTPTPPVSGPAEATGEIKRVESGPYNFVKYGDGEIRISSQGQFVANPSPKLMEEAKAALGESKPEKPIPSKNLSPEEIGAADEMRGMLGGKKAKEPWEMTREEFIAQKREALANAAGDNNVNLKSRSKSEDFGRALGINHRGRIEKALAEGKPVPDAVLTEYPDLKPKRTVADLLKSEKGEVAFGREGEGKSIREILNTPNAPQLTAAGIGEESSKTLRRTMGPEGAELADLSKAMRDDSKLEANQAFQRTGLLELKKNPLAKRKKALNAEQADNLVSVLDEGAAPMDDKVKAISEAARRETDLVASRAKEVKLEIKNPITGEKTPFESRENYFPHMFGPELGEMVKNPDSRALIKQNIKGQLEAGGKEVSDKQVEQTLQAMMKATKNRNAHLEIARVFDAPGYSRDPIKVLQKHFQDAYRRINIAEKFGPELERGEELLTAIGQKYGDDAESFARTYFQRVTGTEPAGNAVVKKAAQAASNYNVFTKMGQAFIANASQPVYTAVVFGAKNTAKAYYAAATKEGRVFAEKILGTSIDDFVRESQQIEKGFLGGAAEKTLTLFNPTERLNRVVTANAAKFFAEEQFAKLVKNPGNGPARRALEKLNFDVDAALKRGSLTEADQLKAGQKGVGRTQFETDVTEIPLFWSSDAGRLLTQFKKFQFKSGQMVKDEILKEIGSGNIKPLLRAAVLLPGAGYLVSKVRDSIRFGQQTEEQRGLADYLATVGTFGAFTDAFAGSGRQPVRGLQQLAGPTLGDAGALWEAGTAITREGNARPMAKFLARQIPVVGPSVRQLFNQNNEKPETTERKKLMAEMGLKEDRQGRKQMLRELGLQ